MIMNKGMHPGASNRLEHHFLRMFWGFREIGQLVCSDGQFALDKHNSRDTTPEQTLMGEFVLYKSWLHVRSSCGFTG